MGKQLNKYFTGLGIIICASIIYILLACYGAVNTATTIDVEGNVVSYSTSFFISHLYGISGQIVFYSIFVLIAVYSILAVLIRKRWRQIQRYQDMFIDILNIHALLYFLFCGSFSLIFMKESLRFPNLRVSCWEMKHFLVSLLIEILALIICLCFIRLSTHNKLSISVKRVAFNLMIILDLLLLSCMSLFRFI